ncbi:MAG: hypothetical protein PHO14_08320 [Kiritimatiellae bacterium]|jgi:hypothetical protein|nr:hypothetical protein [Kiritimatiellia bacterium]MDD4342224.1 hypothetical protein [Kiritimatiellia bacterium]MDY0150039.1 hypothetical protein [Kiritimatiellia bacterium]
MKSNYYKLRCAVVEMFYETLREEDYTIGQATSRCLVEFRREVQGGKQEGLFVLSALLSRVARHEPAILVDFMPEVTALRALGKKPSCWKNVDPTAKERIKEDVRFVSEKAEP